MDVIGIDYPCLDYIVSVGYIPGTDEETDILEDSWQGGGMVPTAMVALGKLGIETGLIGVCGDDIYGQYCCQDFKRHHVNTDGLIVDPQKTTDFCIALSEKKTKGRSFITKWGNRRKLMVEDIREDIIAEAKYLHLCGKMDAINVHAATLAKKNGVKVVLDADQYSEDIEKNLDKIDVLIASEFFYNKRFGNNDYEKNCQELYKKGVSVVVFTLGGNGCVGIQKNEFFQVEAFQVQVIDTTGAGDVFHGAYIYGLLQEWSGEDTARFASAVSGIKCTRLGGRAGIPDLDTVKKFMATGIIDYTLIDQQVSYYQKGMENLLG